jgi:acyl-CoA synthetase (AMP-forming)/AMP-acid ligase II
LQTFAAGSALFPGLASLPQLMNHPSPLLATAARTLGEVLQSHAALRPGQMAYHFLPNGEEERERLSFGELDARARIIAAALQERAAPGSRALLLYPSGLEYIAAFMGCLYAGIVAVPVYPPQMGRQTQRIDSILRDCGASLILSTAGIRDHLREQLPDWAQSLPAAWLVSDLLEAGHAERFCPLRQEESALAFLQYTSGSTGLPKGVRVTHANLLHNQRMLEAACGNGPHSVFASWLPLYHDMGLIGNVLQSLYLGVPAWLMPPIAFIQKPLRWLRLISEARATMSGAPNFAYDLCVSKISPEEAAALDLSSWEVAFNGAEPVRAETLRRFQERFAPAGFREKAFFPCYGMAEATLVISGPGPLAGRELRRLTLDAEALRQDRALPAEEGVEAVGCGRPWLGQELRIVHPETRQPCPGGEVGEIWLRGASVCDGYWEREAESAESFGARTAEGDGPFLRTGDLGFLREGDLYITGRLKDLIIIRGRNHYPQDIEQSAELSHPNLRQGGSAAFSVEAGGEERLVVLQEVEPGLLAKIGAEELFAAIRKAIAQRHELQAWDILLVRRRSILKTSSGKVQRRACKAAYLAGQLQVEARSCLGGMLP